MCVFIVMGMKVGYVYFVYIIVRGDVCMWVPPRAQVILNTPVMIKLILEFLSLLLIFFVFLILLDVVCMIDCVVCDDVWFDVVDYSVDVVECSCKTNIHHHIASKHIHYKPWVIENSYY
jgi:hypothetical protein